MYNDKFVNDYFSIIEKDSEKYYKDFQKLLAKREENKATYKQKPLPTLYQGFYFDKKTYDLFYNMNKIFMGIVKKVTAEYLKEPAYRKLFNFDPLIEKLILKDPGYDIPAPITRFDVMYDGKEDYKFCEFNTDGSSAMLEDRSLALLFEKSLAYQEMAKKYKLKNFDLIESLVDKILEIYDGRPNVAIVDIITFDNVEFTTIKEAFEKRGLKAVIADVRDLKRRNGGLYYKDMKIDLVYRRLVTSDILSIKEEAKDFIDSYLNGEFMTVGSFRSTLFYTKDIFRILRLPQTKEILTEEENNFIEKHIPFTDNFVYQKDKDKLCKNKDLYILKPKFGYASSGIFLGRELSQKEFEESLKKIKDQDYVYQEYYQVEPLKFTTFDEKGQAKLEDFSYVIGLFSYNDQFISTYMRVGQQAIVSSARKDYTIPSFLLEEK